MNELNIKEEDLDTISFENFIQNHNVNDADNIIAFRNL
jgi:hypothetical protein